MERLPDDIGRYIKLSENITSTLIGDDDMSLDNIEISGLPESSALLEDLGDMIFRFRSYHEPDGSQEYARGVEEGLALAANMLESLMTRHGDPSSE